MTIETRPILPSSQCIPEPNLHFNPDQQDDIDIHALRGLVTFGPYSRGTPLAPMDPIRIAFVGPEETHAVISDLIVELSNSHRPRERRQYLVDFPGFSGVFGLALKAPAKDDPTNVVIREEELQRALSSDSPSGGLANLVHSALRRLEAHRSQIDVACLYLPERLSRGFKRIADDDLSDFDLHDSIKALSSSISLPLQLINDNALNYSCRCSVAWRLSLAFYAKAGGIPYKLHGFDPRHAYVGLSYCLRDSGKRKFVTCCSQIFDSEGTNLQFLLYESGDGEYEGRNPFLPKQEMYKIMARTLSLYQHQKGVPPTRLVVHKTTDFTDEEIDGCIDALNCVDNLELLTIRQNTPWFGMKIDPPPTSTQSKKGVAANYPVERGTLLPLGQYEFLLWTQGNSTAVGKKSYFKEGKGIPHPLFITRHLGAGSFFEPSREIIGLTKMNWNNDSFYDRLPVTNSYASVLARTVKRIDNLSKRPYDFRFFM